MLQSVEKKEARQEIGNTEQPEKSDDADEEKKQVQTQRAQHLRNFPAGR